MRFKLYWLVVLLILSPVLLVWLVYMIEDGTEDED